MSEDDDLKALEAKMRKNLFGGGLEVETKRRKKHHLERGIGITPIIEVQSRRVWDSSDPTPEIVLYSRWPGGTREEIFRTQDRAKAEAEIEKHRRDGATVQPLKEW